MLCSTIKPDAKLFASEKEEPLSSFDSFVETLYEMGVEEVLAAYTSAYDRVK